MCSSDLHMPGRIQLPFFHLTDKKVQFLICGIFIHISSSIPVPLLPCLRLCTSEEIPTASPSAFPLGRCPGIRCVSCTASAHSSGIFHRLFLASALPGKSGSEWFSRFFCVLPQFLLGLILPGNRLWQPHHRAALIPRTASLVVP